MARLDAKGCKVLIAYLHGRLNVNETRRALGLGSPADVHTLIAQASRIGERLARRELDAQTPAEETK